MAKQAELSANNIYELRIPTANTLLVKERTAACRILKAASHDGRVFTGIVAGHRGTISAYVEGFDHAYATALDVECAVPARVHVEPELRY